MEEQRLADRRLDHVGIERLRHKEGRLWPLTREQTFWEGCDEDHWNSIILKDFIDRIDARRAVRQLDIRQNQSRRVTRHGVHGLVMGGGGAGDAVAQLLHQAFDVGRDDGLVLDDQYVGGQLGVDVGLSFRDQALDRARIDGQNLGGLGRRKAFQRGQQERLSRLGRDAHQPTRSVVGFGDAAAFQLGPGARPDGVEDVVERHPRRHVGRQLTLARRQGFKRDADIVVARALIAARAPSRPGHPIPPGLGHGPGPAAHTAARRDPDRGRVPQAGAGAPARPAAGGRTQRLGRQGPDQLDRGAAAGSDAGRGRLLLRGSPYRPRCADGGDHQPGALQRHGRAGLRLAQRERGADETKRVGGYLAPAPEARRRRGDAAFGRRRIPDRRRPLGTPDGRLSRRDGGHGAAERTTPCLWRRASGWAGCLRPAVGAGAGTAVLGAAEPVRHPAAAAGGLAGDLRRRHAAVRADRGALAGLSGTGGRHLCARTFLHSPGPGRARPGRNPHPGPHPGPAGRDHHPSRPGYSGCAGGEGRPAARNPPPGEKQSADHLVPAVHAATGGDRSGRAGGAGRHATAHHRPGPDLSRPLPERGHSRGRRRHLPARTGRPAHRRGSGARPPGDDVHRSRPADHRPGQVGAPGPVAGRSRVQRPETRLRWPRRRAEGALQGRWRHQRAGGAGRRPRRRRRRRGGSGPHPDDRLRQAATRRGPDHSRAGRRLNRAADLRHARSPRRSPGARGRSLSSQRNPAPSVALAASAGAHVRGGRTDRGLFGGRDPVEAQGRDGAVVLRRARRGAGAGAGAGRRRGRAERRAHGRRSGRRGGGAGALHPPDAPYRRGDRRARHHPLFLAARHRGRTAQGRCGDRRRPDAGRRSPDPGASRPAGVDEEGQRPDRRRHRPGR
uniref:Chromo domain-containing protein n=1 Tax=Parastrongyloides trichosuri TaxID=131310 RepID=A0A0N5A0B4_PARTI